MVFSQTMEMEMEHAFLTCDHFFCGLSQVLISESEHDFIENKFQLGTFFFFFVQCKIDTISQTEIGVCATCSKPVSVRASPPPTAILKMPMGVGAAVHSSALLLASARARKRRPSCMHNNCTLILRKLKDKMDGCMQNRTWNVACWLCGELLGSNKEGCKLIGKQKKCKFPPCEWAHTDEKFVRTCVSRAAEKKEMEAAQLLELEEIRKKYESGQMNFEEPPHGVDVFNDQRSLQAVETPVPPPFVLATTAPQPKPAITPRKRAKPSADGDDERDVSNVGDEDGQSRPGDEKSTSKTKWNTLTRTMFFRCIQKFDPFNQSDKATVWDTIAQQMHESTAPLSDSCDGDFRVYSNGKTLAVYYARCRDKHKKDEAEGHSGHAGKGADHPEREEERRQLAGCVELERAAKEGLERKREAKSGYDELRKGEVNDMIIALASQHENIKNKAVTVLASKLRQAKMRKIAFEATSKDGKYTYGADDMANFDFWKKLKAIDTELPDDPTEGACTVEKGGGKMAVAIKNLTEQLASATKQVQPMNASDFANAFYAAKRAHEMAGALSLQEKLARVDKDVADKIITSAKGEEVKNKIIDAHYFV
jgi:hypothetical protein